jgi:hypothetical protein
VRGGLWGRGATGTGQTQLSGVWTGAQSRASGGTNQPDGAVEFDFVPDGGSVRGTVRVTTPDVLVFTGNCSGTVGGQAVDVTVNWTAPAGFGTSPDHGTFSVSKG